jgi:hypothetical protein
MKKINLLSFAIATLTITMFSCTDNIESDPIPSTSPAVTVSSSKLQTPQQARVYLSTRSWKLATLKINGKDVTPVTDPSYLDDVFTFRSDSSYTAYENPKSNTSDLVNGTWKLLDDYTLVIRYEGDTEDTIFNLQSIDGSTYVIEYGDYEYTYVEIK